jgi:hypothetical protein
MGREGLASGITADDATAAVHCWWGDQGLDNGTLNMCCEKPVLISLAVTR